MLNIRVIFNKKKSCNLPWYKHFVQLSTIPVDNLVYYHNKNTPNIENTRHC
ncbi:hypothetical protein HMPREF3203_01610 [Proteus mirabilis]|nr:hypothetical protein HMPREF3203_01610 [Proteus mirabilis]